jgi:hypothetical protein
MNEIVVLQNRDDMLELLRAQRNYYRRAKRLQTTFLVFALALPWVGFALKPHFPESLPFLALACVILLLLEIGWATPAQRAWGKTAARIQEQFDCGVLKLGWNEFAIGKKVDPEAIRSVTRVAASIKELKSLKDWYDPGVGALPLSLARLVCQRTNITYDMRVRKAYATGWLIIALLLVGAVMCFGVYDGQKLSTVLVNSIVPFLPFSAFVLREHSKQADTVETLISLKSEVEKLWTKALMTPESPELMQGARNLQDAIYRNRTSNPLVYDWVYWLMRNVNEDLSSHAASQFVKEAQSSLAHAQGVK